MDRWVGKVAVVTGSSSGIGLAISVALVKEGMTVVGIARRKTKMEEGVKAATKGAKGKFYGQECDISIEKNVIDAFNAIKTKFGSIHVLVNNAGLAITGSIVDTKSEDWRKTFDVNVMGLLYCTKEALKVIKQSKVEAHVVNINSIMGHRVHVFGDIKTNVYPATKHAVTAITETLQQENYGENIRFTSISPGYVKTEIVDSSDMSSSFAKIPALESEDVANAVVYVIGTPHRVQINELTLRHINEKTS